MDRDGKSEAVTKGTSSHLLTFQQKTFGDRCRSEDSYSTSTFTKGSVDDNGRNNSLNDVKNFSKTIEYTSLEEKTKCPTLLNGLQRRIINSNGVAEAEKEDCQTRSHTQISANTSVDSEHTSKYVMKKSFDEYSPQEDVAKSISLPSFPHPTHEKEEESNEETSKLQNWSFKYQGNSYSIPIVNVLHSLELKETAKHESHEHNTLDSVLPHSKDESEYGNVIMDHVGSYCGYKVFNKGDVMMQHKTPVLNGVIQRVNGVKSDFIVQTEDGSTMPRWQKILYERQPFEDNYVDPLQFLEELRQNEHLKTYEYTEVVKNTFAITQQISIVILFACAFSMLLNQTVNHYTILYVDLAVFLVAFAVYLQLQAVKANHTNTQDYGLIHLSQIPQVASSSREKKDARMGGRHNSDLNRASPRPDNVSNGMKHRSMNLKRGLSASIGHNGNPSFHGETKLAKPRLPYADSAFSFFRKTIGVGTLVVLLTSILSTLTVSYSNDTIVALSIFTMSLHVLTADYSYLNAYTTDFSPNLSVNAASFGVIMMASRIPNPLDSGALIAFGTFCFSLSPIVRHFVRRTSFTAHVALTFLLFGIDTGCLLTIPVLVILYVTCILMISFVIPWWFVSLHSSVKDQINGPWDEAKPTNSAAAAEWANAGLLS
ncbi:unnamed protein product [Phytomonas sp. EM1]|nr:unnamed protein product [Phytomonas sp. EM1]|eukprot:CCW60038.1 unnamed protein product [Phytomonas sp. isolate EM1]